MRLVLVVYICCKCLEYLKVKTISKHWSIGWLFCPIFSGADLIGFYHRLPNWLINWCIPFLNNINHFKNLNICFYHLWQWFLKSQPCFFDEHLTLLRFCILLRYLEGLLKPSSTSITKCKVVIHGGPTSKCGKNRLILKAVWLWKCSLYAKWCHQDWSIQVHLNKLL